MSIPETVYHWSDTFAVIYSTLISVLGAVLNILLLFIIVNNTPSSMRTYSIVIRAGVVCDLLFCLTTALVTARVFMTEQSLFWIFRGVGTYLYDITQNRLISSRFCFYLYTCELHFFLYSQVLLLYSYIHRYLVITRPFQSFKKFWVQFGCYTFTFLYIVLFYGIYFTHTGTNEEVDEIVRVARPELLNTTRLYSGFVYFNHPIYSVTRNMASIVVISVIVVAGYCSFKIGRLLDEIQTAQPDQVIHRSLLNVLRAQTITSFVDVATIILSMSFINIPEVRTPIVENCIFLPMITSCIITPVVTMLFIRPYKNALYRLLNLEVRVSSVIIIPSVSNQV